jgi:uncharacterized Zn finger protein
MTSPCPRCGATKTDPVWHGVMYKLVRAFGYRMQRCSRCRALRFVRRDRGRTPDSPPLGNEPANAPGFAEEKRTLGSAEARPELKKDQVTATDSSDRDLRCCPGCGSTKYHRTRRTKLERLLRRPPMARCESCGWRFPYPGRSEEYPDTLKLQGPVTVSRAAEERGAPGTGEESSEPKVTQEGTVVDYPNHGLRCCPACGSTKYHRTRRTKLERLLRRPPMARCESCGCRFPHAERPEEYLGTLKLGEPAAALPRPAAERVAPEMGEQSSGPKSTQEPTVVDYPNHGSRCCPACGATKYHRTRRTKLERMLRRPPMARCESCGMRFPYPGHRDESPDSARSGGTAASASPVGEEGRASRTGEESSQSKVDQRGSPAHSSRRGLSRCPFCGSTAYRRSRRTTLEHLLLRPKMARCRNCRKRFPYPKR